MSATLDAAVAAHGLVRSAHTLPEEPLDNVTWSRLLDAARADRLVGLLAAAVTADALPTTVEQYDEANEAHVQAMDVAVRLEQLLVDLAEELGSAGVDVRVLKGPAVAHRFYRDPALRSFADIDLLVRSDAFDDAVRLITCSGGRRQHPQPRPGFDRRFSKGTSFAMEGGMEVDLHRTFVAGPLGLAVDLEDVWSGAWPFELAGVRLYGLDLEVSFLNLCYHAALGDPAPRLVALRDIAEVLDGHDPDAARVGDLARRWRAEAVVARAVTAAHETLLVEPCHPIATWAAAFRYGRRDERALATYTHAGNAYPGQALTALRAIPGIAPKVSYVRALVWPDRSYLSGRYQSRLARWRRGVGALRRRYRQD